MATQSAGRAGRRRYVAALLLSPLLLVTACSHASNESGSSTTGGGSGGTTASAQAAGAGSFGTLKNVCGPGDAKGATARGVTDTDIKVSTGADPSNTAQPGLGQEYFDMADAFTKWCNAAGGINGRKIDLTKRDSQLFNVGKVMNDACQTDFMMVGQGEPFDAAGVQPRVACGLGTIPAFVVSNAAQTASLQVQPGGLPLNQAVVAGYKDIFAKYPGAQAHVGVLGQNLPDLMPVADRYADAITKSGGTVVDKQYAPAEVDNWRPYVEKMKSDGVQILVSTWFAINSTTLVQAMNDDGFHPKAIVVDQSAYNDYTRDLPKQGAVPDLYVYATFIPQDLAPQYPVVKQALDMLHAVKPNADLQYFHISSLNAWLLWAESAKECGSTLTVDCVLQHATRQNWDGGGFFAPNNIAPLAQMNANACVALVQLTSKGFVYDKDDTKPNSGVFNCSPGNTVTLSGTFVPSASPTDSSTPAPTDSSTPAPTDTSSAPASTGGVIPPPDDSSGASAGDTGGATSAPPTGSGSGSSSSSGSGGIIPPPS